MLRISKLTDYGTVILAALAMQPSNARMTATDLAERTHIGLPTVSKLLKNLQRDGLVISTRGSLGGYRLAKPANQISAAAILDSLEGRVALTECSGEHSHCGIANTCGVGHAWQRVNSAIRHSLSEISLSQLAGLDRGTIRGLNMSGLNVRGTSHTVPLIRAARVTQD